MQLLVVQIIVIQKSGKFTGNLLAVCIMQLISQKMKLLA